MGDPNNCHLSANLADGTQTREPRSDGRLPVFRTPWDVSVVGWAERVAYECCDLTDPASRQRAARRLWRPPDPRAL
jgi:hypothetical protein